jgi:uncharacterized protein
MTDTTARIATLDIVRGVAVMGILAMNIVAFAMPPAAYINPLAYGTESALDLASYAFSFVLIDGKMRGLFSFLFGASMLLVIQKAEAKGDNGTSIHLRRQLVLLLFGALHFYLIWYGDILFAYAVIGLIAFAFRKLPPRKLIVWGSIFILVELAMMSAMALAVIGLSEAIAQPGASPDLIASWDAMTAYASIPSPDQLQQQLALIRGPWTGILAHQTGDHVTDPLFFTIMFGPETLGYMLFGMAALKSGFLTGGWDDARYTRVATIGFAIAIPLYLVFAWQLFSVSFSVPALFTWSMAATVPVRPVMIIAIAATVILLTRGHGPLTQRIEATGRAAFTNYLGTSILMTALFYGWGLGLFGELTRSQLWLVVLAMWLVMLAWSKPWLERYRYGPLEWLWRTLARGKVQEMRR